MVALAVGGLSFGAIRGQERNWQDPLAYVALADRRRRDGGLPDPDGAARTIRWCRCRLFRSRNFSVTNLSTLLIYGALYVFSVLQLALPAGHRRLHRVGVGAVGRAVEHLPRALLDALRQPRRPATARACFMAVGPAIMGVGPACGSRGSRSTARPWLAEPVASQRRCSRRRAISIDTLPSFLLFGLGLTIMVAPLTTALMRSVPAANAGIAFGVNNAISRVGPQLAGAVIFIAITASSTQASRRACPASIRRRRSCAHRCPRSIRRNPSVPPEIAAAAHDASTDSYHLAMLVAGGLLFLGAGVNAVGIRNTSTAAAAVADVRTRRGRGLNRPVTRDWDARTYDRIAHPMARWGEAVLARLPLAGAERVLDAGCGSGRVTEQLLARVPAGSVVALDASPRMVEEARSRLGADSRVEYVVADLGRPLPIASGRRGLLHRHVPLAARPRRPIRGGGPRDGIAAEPRDIGRHFQP